MGDKIKRHNARKDLVECGPTGKRFYKNTVLADEAVQRFSKRGLTFRVYLCVFCAGYHLTRQSKKKG